MLLKSLIGFWLVTAYSFASAQSQLIAEIQPGTSASAIASAARVKLVDTAPGSPFYLYRTLNNENPDFAQARLVALPGVVWAEDDSSVEQPENSGGGKGSTVAVIGGRSQLYARNAAYLNQVRFSSTRALAPGRAVRIAILDTGLSPMATGLWARVVGSFNVVERNQAAYDVARGTDSNGNFIADEGLGHGTFVAGIVDQIAPQSSLLIVRVADSDGLSNAWNIIRGIVYAAANRCEVANISLGSVEKNSAMDDVIEWALAKGLLVVSPTGNRGREEIFFPAKLNKVLSVTGVDSTDRKASFSNFDGKVNSAAPSTGVYSTWSNGNMGLWSGTSFAAPFLTGAIADCLKRRPKAYPLDLRVAAIQGGDIINAVNPGYSNMLGRRLNINSLDLKIRALPIRP